MIRIELRDLPPSTNNLRTSFIKDGKVMSVKSKGYADWRKAAVWEIAAQRAGRVEGPYRLKVSAQRNWKSKRARDVDNLLKPISDALVEAGTVSDDSLAESVYAEWSDDVIGIRIEVEAVQIARGEAA